MPPVITEILINRRGASVEVILQPEGSKPPTLHDVVLDELDRAITALADQPPRAVVVRSASDRFFCVGADVSALEELDDSRMAGWVEHGHRVLNRLSELPCPVLAAVRGYALGGGLELAMACDVMVVDATAKLGLTEASLGFVPGWGGSPRLAERIGKGKAKAMFFTGAIVDAESAVRDGLADRMSSDLDATIDELLAQIESRSEVALSGFKALLAPPEIALQTRLSNEVSQSLACIGDPSTSQRIQAFLNERIK